MFGIIYLTPEAIWSWAFGGNFLINDLISLLVIGHWMFLEMYPFLLCCPICLHVTVYSNLLQSFLVLVVSSLSFLILLISVQFSHSVMSDSLQFGPFYLGSFIDLGPLCFSWWVWLKVFQFYLFENQFFVSYIFSILCMCEYHFIYFYSDLYFPLKFCFSFFSSFRYEVKWFEIFLTFWGRPVLLRTSLLEQPLLYAVDFETLCFHFHLSQGIPFWFFSVTDWLFSGMLFRLHLFVFFSGSWFLVS